MTAFAEAKEQHDWMADAYLRSGIAPGGIMHGYSIRWGDRLSRATGFATKGAMEKARREEFQHMRSMGWTPPLWWQFWRANDTRL